jgi:predicted metalloprotease with PDZ domain
VERRAAVDPPHYALLGVKTTDADGECRIANVFDGSPAQAAGLSGGDTLIALGGLRVKPKNLDALLARYHPGDAVEVLAFRRDELMRFDVELATRPPPRFVLTIDPKAGAAARRARQRWLAG